MMNVDDKAVSRLLLAISLMSGQSAYRVRSSTDIVCRQGLDSDRDGRVDVCCGAKDGLRGY